MCKNKVERLETCLHIFNTWGLEKLQTIESPFEYLPIFYYDIHILSETKTKSKKHWYQDAWVVFNNVPYLFETSRSPDNSDTRNVLFARFATSGSAHICLYLEVAGSNPTRSQFERMLYQTFKAIGTKKYKSLVSTHNLNSKKPKQIGVLDL